MLSVQSHDAGLKLYMHGKEFPHLYYPIRVSDDRQGVGIYCLNLVLPIQLRTWVTLYVFGGCGFPSGLFMVPTCPWDSQVLEAVLDVYTVSFW